MTTKAVVTLALSLGLSLSLHLNVNTLTSPDPNQVTTKAAVKRVGSQVRVEASR